MRSGLYCLTEPSRCTAAICLPKYGFIFNTNKLEKKNGKLKHLNHLLLTVNNAAYIMLYRVQNAGACSEPLIYHLIKKNPKEEINYKREA